MKKAIAALFALCLTGLVLAQSPADTFVYQTYGEPVSLDPIRAYDTGSGTIIENVYETLYTYDGAAIDEFVPALATSHTVSEDGTTYTFQLRDGVQFHSGNTLTCRDVEYSFEYGLVTANSEGAVMYLMGDQLVGTQMTGEDPAAYQAEVSWEEIDQAAECPEGDDGLVFELNLTHPDPALIAIITYTAFSVVDSQFAIEGGSWDGTEATWTEWIGRDLTQEFLHTNMSGTGAYQLQAWNQGESVVVQAFENYWGGAPDIKNVVVEYVDEQSTRILALQQGDADRITLNERAALVQLRGAPGVVVHEDPSWAPACVTAGFFNFDINTENNEDVGSGELDGSGIPSDFFADANVRLAFSHLFDQQGYIEQIYDGEGVALTMGLPPSFLGYNEDIPIRTLDLEAAEGYFRKAFDGQLWEQGFEFTALYNAGNTLRQTVLQIIADNLSFINPNFRMNVRSLPWADFLTRTAEQKAPMFVLGWCADYADPRNFINTFYDNDGYYSDRTSINVPSMQELIDQAEAIVDPAERAFLYRQVGVEHYETAPLITIPAQSPFILTTDAVQGVYFNPMLSAEFKWKDISKE
ncbi:MAG TPA: ABC transporter substrate-binding protein [Trueperaceae bacterium]